MRLINAGPMFCLVTAVTLGACQPSLGTIADKDCSNIPEKKDPIYFSCNVQEGKKCSEGFDCWPSFWFEPELEHDLCVPKDFVCGTGEDTVSSGTTQAAPTGDTPTTEPYASTTGALSTTTTGETQDESTTNVDPYNCDNFCSDCPKEGQSPQECLDTCQMIGGMCLQDWELYLECFQGELNCMKTEGENACTDQLDTFSMCQSQPQCGDCFGGIDEECDDGNLNDNDGCSSTCTLESTCGDGKVEYGELCDDGDRIDNNACNNLCTLSTCGDGQVDAGEECDDGMSNGVGNCLFTCVWRAGECTENFQERSHTPLSWLEGRFKTR